MRSDPSGDLLLLQSAVDALVMDLLRVLPRLRQAADLSWRSPAAQAFRSSVDAAADEVLALSAALRSIPGAG